MVYQLVNNGDVPDEDYFNNALMRQTIIKCTSGTRPASPDEGMTIYETDTGLYVSHDGTNWKTIGQNFVGSFTPTLTAASVNPNLGTTAVREGRYILHNGNTCTYWGYVQFSGSSIGAGSGQYYISTPVTSSAGVTITCGSAILRDFSGAAVQSATSFIGTSVATISFLWNGNVTNNTVPWTWASTDYISWNITFEYA